MVSLNGTTEQQMCKAEAMELLLKLSDVEWNAAHMKWDLLF